MNLCIAKSFNILISSRKAKEHNVKEYKNFKRRYALLKKRFDLCSEC